MLFLAAIELALAYIELDRVIKLGFAPTTYGQYLDYRAAEHGLTRKAATKSVGQVTIIGSQGAVVPSGSLFATGASIQFRTIDEVIIEAVGQVSADIEAVNTGVNGNVPAATITAIPVSIPGVTAVTNANPTTGGTDTESDLAFMARLLEKVRLPATSGNIAHYLQWAKEVSGVGDAKVIPIWNGPGTVKVVIIDSNKQPASSELIQNVSDYIEEMRPVGSAVTVVSATGLNIDVSADVTLADGYVIDTVKPEIETAITNYLMGIAFKQNYVSYAHIGSLILDTDGVLDYTNFSLNGDTSNIIIGTEQVSVKGTVTLT